MNTAPTDGYNEKAFEGESTVRTMFDQSRPASRPVDMDRLTSLTRRSRIRLSDRSRLFRTVAAVAMSGLVACSIASVVIVAMRPTSTFAHVQATVAATKSVRYVVRPVRERANDDLNYANGIITEGKHRCVEIKNRIASATGNEKRKLEKEFADTLSAVTAAENYLLQRGDTPPGRIVSILGRYQQREESKSIGGDMIDIVNRKTGKSIRLHEKEKSATLFTKQITFDGKGGKSERDIVEAPDLTVDFYGRIRDIPNGAIRLEETKLINDSKHIGFRVSEVTGPYTWTRTFWVDPETHLPAKIEISARSEDRRYGPSDAVIEDIEFDVALDESLFSTDVPAGYTLKKSSLVDFKLK